MKTTIKHDNSKELFDSIEQSLRAYNSQSSKYMTQEFGSINLGYRVSDENNKIVGGVYGYAICNQSWFSLDILWVDPDYRGKDIGTELIKNLERDIREIKTCETIKVETWDFQAKDFYLKMGYKIVGEVPNCPPGTIDYILIKNLK